MTCDQFLPVVATGGTIRRRLALRHAARCPACAAALAGHRALTASLAAAPPLTARERRLWLRAATAAQAASPPPRDLWVALLLPSAGWGRAVCYAGGSVAAAVVLLVVVVRFGPASPPVQVVKDDPHHTVQLVEPPIQRSAVAVSRPDLAAETSRLSADLDRLEGELARLQRKIERVEARRQVAVVLDQHDRW